MYSDQNYVQMQQSRDILQNSCSEDFKKIQRKIPVTLVKLQIDLLYHGWFYVNVTKPFEAGFLQNNQEPLLVKVGELNYTDCEKKLENKC